MHLLRQIEVEAHMDVPSELQEWPDHVGNWGRWPNDHGALNLITPAATARGIACAREGRDDFLFMASALNIPKTTGSLCTPIAVL